MNYPPSSVARTQDKASANPPGVVRFERRKPRNWLASLAYKLKPFVPLDFWLDLEWVAWRMAHEKSVGVAKDRANHFLLDAIGPDETVLDLGCGEGIVACTITARRVVGIDHDRPSIEAARARCPGVEFVCADARDYLAAGHAFDVLVMSHVLEHLDRPEQLLTAFADKFKRIYIEVPDFDSQPLNRVRQARGRRLLYTDDDHVAEYDRTGLEALLADCGLAVLDREFIGGVMRYWVAAAA